MQSREYFLRAIAARAHYQRDWVLRAFTEVQEGPEDWKKRPTPWRLVRMPTGYFYVDPETLELTKLEESELSGPLFTAKQVLEVPAGMYEHWPEGGLTTAGNLLFNATALWPSVGARLGYMNDAVSMGKLEQLFADRLTDTPLEGVARDPRRIYVDEYLRFADAVGYLQEFMQVFCTAVTEKALIPPTGLKEKKAEVLAKYKDHLNDPLTQTKIYKELVAFDAEFLKGDPSEDFLISAKSRETVRRKLYLIQGAEPGLTTSQQMPLIEQSLTEGWQKESLPELINTLRAGSFDRGSETELGGVEAKWLMRSTSNIRVTEGDCGTQLGKKVFVDASQAEKLQGRYFMQAGKPRLIESSEAAQALIGKNILVRSPAYCQAPKTDFCPICLGAKLSANTNAVSMAATAYGSGFLSIFLGAMHGKAMKSVKMDLEACLR